MNAASDLPGRLGADAGLTMWASSGVSTMRDWMKSSLMGLVLATGFVLPMGCESGGKGSARSTDGADGTGEVGVDEADATDGEALADGAGGAGANDADGADGADGTDVAADSTDATADSTDGAADAMDGATDAEEDGDTGADASIDEPDGTDVLPVATPTIVATLPEHGQKGVMPDASISIEFSEPMDPKSVEAAWLSKPLPADDVIFSWDASGRFLSVTPKALLEVASGFDPAAVEATPYWFIISEDALAADGTPLGADVTVEFTTIRRIVQNLPVVPELTGAVRSDATNWTTIWVGDSSAANATYVGVMSFDLAVLPSGAQLSQAALQFIPEVNEGAPYITLGKAASLHDASFESRQWSLVKDSVYGEVVSSLGAVVQDPNDDVVSMDVAVAVASDISLGASLTQFAVAFPALTDGDGAADNLELLKPLIVVDYIVP